MFFFARQKFPVEALYLTVSDRGPVCAVNTDTSRREADRLYHHHLPLVPPAMIDRGCPAPATTMRALLLLLLAAAALLLALPRAARCQPLPPLVPLDRAPPPLAQVLQGAPPLPAVQRDLEADLQRLTDELTAQLQQKFGFCMADVYVA